jgi:hypothetical protein
LSWRRKGWKGSRCDRRLEPHLGKARGEERREGERGRFRWSVSLVGEGSGIKGLEARQRTSSLQSTHPLIVRVLFSPKLISITPSSQPVETIKSDEFPQIALSPIPWSVDLVCYTSNDLPNTNRRLEIATPDGAVESEGARKDQSLDITRERPGQPYWFPR